MTIHANQNLKLRGGDTSGHVEKDVEPFSDDFPEELNRYEAKGNDDSDTSKFRAVKRRRFERSSVAMSIMDDNTSLFADDARHCFLLGALAKQYSYID